MMKTYSKIAILTFVFVVMGLVFSPIFADAKNNIFGQNQNNPNNSNSEMGQGNNSSEKSNQSNKPLDNIKGNLNFCSNINKMVQLEERLVDAQLKMEQKRNEQQQKTMERLILLQVCLQFFETYLKEGAMMLFLPFQRANYIFLL